MSRPTALQRTFDRSGIAERGRAAYAARYAAVSRRGLLMNGFAFLLLVLAGTLLATNAFPTAGFTAINAAGRPLPDWLLANLTELGNTAVIAAIVGLFARRHPQLLFAFVIATLLGAIAINGLKAAVALPRPPAVLGEDALRLVGTAYSHGSFPSGHTFATFASAAVAVAFLRSMPWQIGLLLGALIVGASRVLIGVHWPVDVLAGAAGGLAVGTAAVLLSRTLSFGYRPAAQVAMIWLVLVSNVVLIYNGSNYALAAPMSRTLAVVSIAAIAWQYLWRGRRT